MPSDMKSEITVATVCDTCLACIEVFSLVVLGSVTSEDTLATTLYVHLGWGVVTGDVHGVETTVNLTKAM